MPNPVEGRSALLQEFNVRNPQHVNAFRLQPPRTCFIIHTMKLFAVLPAVKFYNQLCGGTVEVSNVRADRLLPAKAQPVNLLAPKQRPELLLSLRRFTAELLGEFAL